MRIFVFMIFLVAVMASGCGKRALDKGTPAPPAPVTSFEFTSTNKVVTKEDMKIDDERKIVKADFNMDGLSDLAVIRSDGISTNEVTIYIKKPFPATESSARVKTYYYQAGAVRRPLEGGRITGIASHVGEKAVDLIILVSYTNRPNDMIHYYNDGKRFAEKEVWISSANATTNKPLTIGEGPGR